MATQPAKVRQPFLKYDSIIIGPSAKDLDAGFFNDWPAFSRSSTIKWFVDRSSSVPNWASSSNTDRSDWAFEIHQAGIEFMSPAANTLVNTNATDNWMPEMFSTKLVEQMCFEFQVADTDMVLKIPGVHAPAGVGASGLIYDGSTTANVHPATNGVPTISNSWKFPDPLKVSMRSMMTVQSRMEEPLNTTFSNITGPGNKFVPNGAAAGGFTFTPCWYVIRVWLRGARFIDNVGARG